MKLYGCRGCGSAAVEALLEMTGVAYEFVDAIQWSPYRRHADLERLNPLGQVPTLLFDDGSVMTESGAMLMYFAERMPGLIPTDPVLRAACYRWMFFIPSNMYAVYAFRDFPDRWIGGEEQQKAFREKCNERLREYWRVLEASLRSAPYVLGASMSVVDVYLAMLSRWAPGRPWLMEHCPQIMGAVLKTEQHPVVKRVWERNFGE